MTQLILSIILLYLVVGSVGYWATKRQRHLRSLDQSTARATTNQTR